MKLVTQLRIAILLILGLGLCSAGLMLWNLQQSRLHIERINIAQSIYARYLNLESHIYQLFKQYGDAIIIGDANQRASKIQLIEVINTDIKTIRRQLKKNLDLVGENQTGEEDSLIQIEQTVEQLIRRLDQFSPTGTGELASDWSNLSRLLNDEIDENFRSIIQRALDQQKQNVSSTISFVDKAALHQRIMAAVFAFLGTVAAIAGITMLNRRFTRPINTLVGGVREFGEGHLDYRINPVGRDEVAEIGRTFDTMAAQISHKNQILTTEKHALQDAVDERTRQLSIMLEDVKRSDSSRKLMIADVSHELRTPLTIMRGEADIALRGEEKSPRVYREALTRVREAANHTARLVDDLLFVARTEAGEVRLKMSNIDLRTVLFEVQQTFGQEAVIDTSLATAPLRADAGRVKQALLVLLENARHYGGDRILMRLDTTDNGFCISVEDNGSGMSDTTKQQAFERFFRGSNAAERYQEGSGLGIPVALSIAKAHGGTITLSDRPGGGLIAALSLPEQSLMEHVA